MWWNGCKGCRFVPLPELLNYLSSRRSVKVKSQTEPAPSRAEIEQILTIAARVPDHGKLAPFRFVVLEKDAQAKLGDRLAEIYAANNAGNSDITEKHIQFERERPQRAPLLIVVIFSYKPGKIPLWEQQLACGAACMNLLHGVYAHCYVGQWLTEWPAFDAQVKAEFSCMAEEEIAGFFYIGSSDEKPDDRARPALSEITEWR